MYNFAADTRPKLDIKKISVSPDRMRKDFALVMDLKKSIEENGLLQPIGVNLKDGIYKLVFGETRYRACLMIPELNGLVPVTVFENLTPVEEKLAELEENLRRKDINWQEQIDGLAQLEALKRETLGDQTKENPDGWSLKKTADIAQISPGLVSQQVNFSKKLRERPDIKEKVKHLPLNVAMKVTAQIEEAEKVERMANSGEIVLDTNFVHSDALFFLKSLPDNSVDLWLTDPPFGMTELEDRRGEQASSSQSYMGKLKEHDNSTASAVIQTLTSVIPEMARTLKPGCHFYMFFELELLGEIKSIFSGTSLNIQWPILLWDKQRTTNSFLGYNYLSCYEAIIYGYKGETPRRLSESSPTIIRVPALHASKKLHPFEKPLDLLAGFIKRSTNFGDVVGDPFAGSASTLVAARQSGRKALGCELDKENWLKAQSRLLIESHLNVPATPQPK